MEAGPTPIDRINDAGALAAMKRDESAMAPVPAAADRRPQ
jgi:hypothetical protein